MLYPSVGVPYLGDSLLCRFMQHCYTSCLERAGARVQILKANGSGEGETVEGVLDQCSGFLFPGGPDIQPSLYGKEAEPGCGMPDLLRDAFELPLLQTVLEARKPLFCIGRGMELLNVALGGTLIQDIRPKQEYQHHDFWHLWTATHPIEIDRESLLGDAMDVDSATVNSLHHQAVDTLGKDLWIIADSPEGYPEALELDRYPFCLAMQWHPEHMARQTPVQQKLFQAFVEACRMEL